MDDLEREYQKKMRLAKQLHENTILNNKLDTFEEIKEKREKENIYRRNYQKQRLIKNPE